MKIINKPLTRAVALLAATSIVAACGVPRLGPNKREIYAGSVEKQGDAFVVQVNNRVTRATAVIPALGFSSGFKNASVVGSDTISPGDTLGLTIWENVDDPLLAAEAANATILEEVQVDGSGFIFVPYAGRIKAAGNSPEATPNASIHKLLTPKCRFAASQGMVQLYPLLAQLAVKASMQSNAQHGHCPQCLPAQVA